FGSSLPALHPDQLAARFQAAAGAPDLTTRERSKLSADVDAWRSAATAALVKYTADFASPGRAPSALDRGLAGLRLLNDGPHVVAPDAPAATFPFVRVEPTVVAPTTLDARWVSTDLPPRFTPTAIWDLITDRPLGPARLCADPQHATDRLIFFDGASWFPA